MRFMRDKKISDRTQGRVIQYIEEFFQEEGMRDYEIEEKILT